MLHLPIGVDDFSKIKEYYYVDKTLFIKDILDYCQYRTILFTKPRRFGKSLNLSMVEHYFTNHGDHGNLFKDLNIASCGDKYLAHQGKYPVIHLNFKDISASNYADFTADLMSEISRVFRLFPELINAKTLFEIDQEKYLTIANERTKNINDYADALKHLSQLLCSYYKQPCVILVDEYDTPLSIAYQNGFFEEAITFFRKFYSSFSKSNPNVFFVLLTGITEISKESIFSEMNNVDIYTIADKEFSQYFGFTDEEIKKMCNSLGVAVDMAKLNQWYGGYGPNGTILNPWSILNYINRGSFDPYWINTGSNFAIRQVLGEDRYMIEALNEALVDQDVSFDFYRGISYRDLRSNKDILFSLLIHAGYLTFAVNQEGMKTLRLPNIESEKAFEREVVSRVDPILPLAKASKLRHAIETRDVNMIRSIFEDMIDSSFSYLDLNKEKEYQSMVVALLAVLFGEYTVKSEVNGRYGRCDVLLSPKKKDGIGIVIEIKKHQARLSEAKFEQSAVAALKQIHKHHYYQDLLSKGSKHIILYAFVFDGVKMRAKAETIGQ